jgi:hypothetical protein
MSTVDKNTLQASANLTLWFKTYTSDALTLADMPEIVPMRWTYFRDNWSRLRSRLLGLASSTNDPDYFRHTLDDLTDFISKQQLDTTDVNPFANNNTYFRFYPVFDKIKLESITLTNEERTLVTNKQLTLKAYSKIDFLKIKKTLREYRDTLADAVGLSDPDYDAIYDRAPIRGDSAPSLTDLNLMRIIEQQLSTVDFILANLFAVDTAIDPFALARLNANNPEINIGQYKSGRLVKLNAGEDLPSLSKRIFGNSDKWIDIAIANGLKDPYIDEVGTQLFLIANGRGNQINLAATDTFGNQNINRFFINQPVLIRSDTNPFPTQRTITGIKQIPLSGEIVLTVSGDPNMNLYLLSDNANIRVFKPNTINSSQYILIPSERPLQNLRSEEIPWFLTGSAADEKNTKVDIAVGENGALLHNADGDLTLSYGLDNAVQAIKAKLLTELGSNRRHPGYGLINLVGTPSSQSDDVKNTLIKAINEQVAQDGRFDRVQSLDVTKNPSTQAVAYDVTLVVKLTGSNTFLPITFTVNS